MKITERYEQLVKILHEVTDFDDANLNRSDRKHTSLRMLVAYQLRSDGYPLLGIAQCIGRSHSIVIDAVRKWESILEDNFRFGWYEEYELWKEFKKKVDELDAEKKMPVYEKYPVMTLGQFRELTASLPDSTLIKAIEKDFYGAEFRVSFDKKSIFLFNNK